MHCAVLGGNINILKCLVEKNLCPVAFKHDVHTGRLQSVQTSTGRSLVDLAMTGRPKLEILRYLVMEKKLSVLDTKDPSLAPRALDALLRSGASLPPPESVTRIPMETFPGQPMVHVIDDLTENSDTVTLDDAVSSEIVSWISDHSNNVKLTIDHCQCILCYEKSMDCVLIPCGHQVCCQHCGKQLNTCPLCKGDCSVLRIFRN